MVDQNKCQFLPQLLHQNLEESREKRLLSESALNRASASAATSESEWSATRARLEAAAEEAAQLRRGAEKEADEARAKVAAGEVEIR